MAYGATVLAKSDRTDRRAPKLVNTLTKLVKFSSARNMAEDLDDIDLDKMGHEVARGYKIDKTSREEWATTAEKAMNVALQVRQPKNYPFENAANVKYPLVTVAALQFGARAYPAIIDGNRVVKCQIVGSDKGIPATDPQTGQPVIMQNPQTGQPEPQWQIPPGAKREKANRISEHMSYQLLQEMEEWEEDTDVLLHHIPIIGCAFRKVWRSEELGRNKSEMIPAIHLVVNNKVRSLNEAPRITHEIFLYPQDIEERKRTGSFLDIDLPLPNDAGDDEDAPHMFLEQHCFWDMDEDGYREPYIVTIHEQSNKVVRIVANFRMKDIKHDDKEILRIPRSQYFVKYGFIPDPRGGFYDIGFGRLLESLSETIDTALNQMLDAGHLQTAGGGFIGSGIRLKKNTIKVAPGKWEQISVNGDLRSQVMPFQHQGPSPVLFQLLGMMIEAARDITAVKDILTGDTGDKGVQTATTTLALIEQGLKVFTAIYKRVYRSLKAEFKLLFALNAEFLDDKTYFNVLDQEKVIAKSDYDEKSLDVCPVADPKMVTDMQKMSKTQVLLQFAENPVIGPQLNPREIARRSLESVGIEDMETLLKPEQQGPSPEQQLMIAEKQAQIKGIEAKAEHDTAGAQKDVALAHKATVDAQIAPIKAEHEGQLNEMKAEHAGHMAENKARTDAATLHLNSLTATEAADLARQELQHRSDESERRFEADKAKAQSKTE